MPACLAWSPARNVRILGQGADLTEEGMHPLVRAISLGTRENGDRRWMEESLRLALTRQTAAVQS